MDYFGNAKRYLTISGESLDNLEAHFDPHPDPYSFIGCIRDWIDHSVSILKKDTIKANEIIPILFDLEKSYDVICLVIDEFSDEEFASKIFYKQLKFYEAAHFLVLLDRLVTATKNNQGWRASYALAEIISYISGAHANKGISENNRKAAFEMHKAKLGSTKKDFITWYLNNKSRFKSKAEAARAGIKEVGMQYRTLEKWIREIDKKLDCSGGDDD